MIDFLLRPFRRNFGPDKRFYAAIDDMFGFIPNNIELYKLALIHKSASVVIESGQHINNERLEFLGDAVIESVTSDYLFIEFPEKNEGFLTQLRSKMVSRQALNGVAKRIGLDDYVITSTSGGSSQKHIYGDAFEAMMGAIYLDQGYDFVNRLLINKIFVKYLKIDTLLESETDFKSRLIEWCQKNHHAIQFVTTHDKSYSSSHPYFYAKVLIDGIEAGYGAGESKKEAEQRAAYSVSQGFSDEDCTKLLDKLDNLDRRLQVPKKRKSDDNQGQNPAEKVVVKRADKEVELEEKLQADIDTATEPETERPQLDEPTLVEPAKPRAPRRRRAAKKEEVKEEMSVTKSVAESDAAPEEVAMEVKAEESKIVADDENVEQEPAKPVKKARKAVPSRVKTLKDNTAEESKNDDTALQGEKPKKSVRRRKKTEQNEESSR